MMKHFWGAMIAACLLVACNTEEASDVQTAYRGNVKAVSVQSFKISSAASDQKELIMDSLPGWIPIEEYSKTFNDKGQLLEQTLGTLYSSAPADTIAYNYDVEGKLFTKEFRSPEPDQNRLTKYMYNVDDQMNAINVFLPDQELDSVFLFNYDSEGVLRSINEFHNQKDYEDFVATLVRKYFYTVKNMIRIDHYGKNPYTGKHYYAKRVTKKFKSNGKLFEEKIESGGTTVHKYEYHKNGLLASILTYDGSNQLIEKTGIEYDQYGNTVLKSFQSDVGSFSYRCEYRYDDQQNWIEKKIFIADGTEPSYIVQRSFTYQ